MEKQPVLEPSPGCIRPGAIWSIVMTDRAAKKRKLRKLGPGLYFGSMSLPVSLSVNNQYFFFRYLEIAESPSVPPPGSQS